MSPSLSDEQVFPEKPEILGEFRYLENLSLAAFTFTSRISKLRYSALNTCRWLSLLTLVCLAGCSGCQPDPADQLTREEIEKRAKEKAEALEMSDVLSLPTDSDTKFLFAKPGHWIETRQQFKSNREDLQVVAVGSVAYGEELTKIPGTDMVNEYTRRTSFPKGQTKSVDLQYFVPFSGRQEDPYDLSLTPSHKLNFRTQLLTWPLMTPILQAPSRMPANELKEHEFQLAVLSPQALGYDFLKNLDIVEWRGDELMVEERIRSYVVSLVKPLDNQYAFPHTMLTMTALAVLVWDDVDVDNLSSDQQQAIVDWLHWGGTLVISGPSSWSRLQNSFLSRYLPANTAESVELGTEAFSDLSNTWVTHDKFAPGDREPLKFDDAAITGLRFQLNERGQWLPGSGELVAETSIGRGRIAVTSFPLREPRIYRWKYFSSFFSTGLLRRPARTVKHNNDTRALEQAWTAEFAGRERDPRLHSDFRILSRDLPLSSGASIAAFTQPTGPIANNASNTSDQRVQREVTVADTTKQSVVELNTPANNANKFESSQWGTGGAAWNDYSGLSIQILNSLKAAAGIELPSRKTILILLAGYLACLVPLNWAVFRVLGRLEYAWLAAPLLAIVGVGVVTRVARLDIGFARRTTEISLLELHGDHPRGHLSQYIALYTSLSTNYAIDFPENGSVALPLGDQTRARRRAAAETRNLRTNYGRSDGVTLEPLTVYSNSTEMVHAEQIVALPGGLVLGTTSTGQEAVKNTTGLNLRGVLVVRCVRPGTIESCWVGELAGGAAAELPFRALNRELLWQEWNRDPSTQVAMPVAAMGEDSVSLWIGGVLAELVQKTPLVPGQTRLFAYTDDRPGDLKVTPGEDQFDGRCVVVAHLSSPTLGPVKPDEMILSRSVSAELEPVEIDKTSENELENDSKNGGANEGAELP